MEIIELTCDKKSGEGCSPDFVLHKLFVNKQDKRELLSLTFVYISESMCHLQGNDVTDGYQDMYPLEIRFRNKPKSVIRPHLLRFAIAVTLPNRFSPLADIRAAITSQRSPLRLR
ncbi:hypothetical protein EII32_06730 [Prevotella sp. OH937_COT-195]|nr:hypothetical protein EII32_06730 [Prevotella sp. OH937_COT-195]